MHRGVLALSCVALVACAPASEDDPCVRAIERRGEGRALASEGRLTRALAAIDEANGACPRSRAESWAVEVKLLAELGRCGDAASLADAIDAAPWRGDGAWLSSAVARDECKAAAVVEPDVMFDEADRRSEAGDRAGARRAYERAIAASRQPARADFIRWTHKEPGPMAWVGADAVLVADMTRASLLSTLDWHERMSLDARRAIRWVATSPGGHVVATSDGDEIRVWDVDRRALRASVEGDGPIALSERALGYVHHGAVVVIDAGTGRQRGSLRVEGPVAMTTTAHGFAVVADHEILFLDEGAHVLRSVPTPFATAAAAVARADGSLLVVHADVRSAELGLERVAPSGATQILGDPLELVLGVSPDGRWLVREHGDRAILAEPGGKDGPRFALKASRALVSPDGKSVLYRDFAGLHRLDATTGKDHVVVPTATAPVEDIAVLAGGEAIAVRGTFHADGHVWTAAGPTRVPALDEASWRHGGELIVVTRGGSYDVLDARTGALLRHGDADPNDDVWTSADGERVAFSSQGRRRFVDVRTSAADTTTFLDEQDVGFDPADGSLFVTRDGSHLRWRAVPSLSLVRTSPVAFGLTTRLLDGPGEPAVVVSGSKEQVSSLATGRVLFEGKALAGVSLVRRADGSFLRLGREHGDGERAPFHVYDAEGKIAATFTPYAHECESYGVPPDGRWLAAGCKEGSIVVWSTETYQIILVLRPFPDAASGYALEPATGHVEIFGDPPIDPVCRVGARSVPFEACSDLAVEPGLVARVLGSPAD